MYVYQQAYYSDDHGVCICCTQLVKALPLVPRRTLATVHHHISICHITNWLVHTPKANSTIKFGPWVFLFARSVLRLILLQSSVWGIETKLLKGAHSQAIAHLPPTETRKVVFPASSFCDFLKSWFSIFSKTGQEIPILSNKKMQYDLKFQMQFPVFCHHWTWRKYTEHTSIEFCFEKSFARRVNLEASKLDILTNNLRKFTASNKHKVYIPSQRSLCPLLDSFFK